ncbi:GNAT family N-acetyltransferase [Anatilimnocola floriformis]|uniref:GNAT family N-acetyltransferase n=1 Tax=Anatilimnocola floriformis TaxID=2948575 RepID=UPI0020C2DFCE|nr:GNAT family N-acetyltransferase [Anatilimnocola floriformis]
MKSVELLACYRWSTLHRDQPRKAFSCGQVDVDVWLKTKALQHQDKRLSVTKVLLAQNAIAGFYTLATGQVDFGDLPTSIAKGLPRRALPVAVLAWLGISSQVQGQGLGRILLSQALLDCHTAGQTFAFTAVVLDCVNDQAKAFYQRFDFQEVPGRPYRLYLSAAELASLLEAESQA